MAEPEVEIPETDDPEHDHEHTPGYPAHTHDGDVPVYTDSSVSADEFDLARHGSDVIDQAERARQAMLLGPAELGQIMTAAIQERGGAVTEITDPADGTGGVSFRILHPRSDGAMRVDVYPE